jgi:5-oxoprolinase (ATP-hydrolysing) subunit C
VTGALVVKSAGPSSSVQDGGRPGWLRYGLAAAGAADPIALAAANALVGNPSDSAAIEFTLAGDTVRVEADAVRIAVAGAAAITIDGAPAPAWTSHRLVRGQTLAVGRLTSGVRGYLAVAGGIATEPVMGSRAAHLKAGIGGRLRSGDRLPVVPQGAHDGPPLTLDPAVLPYVPLPLHVVLGPQDDRFTAEGIAAFLNGTYRVTTDADRMGLRLDGPPVDHAGGFNTISDGIAPGTVQVPGSRQPILLLCERQSTGGYPKIATVATACLPTAAQLKPGDSLSFLAVAVAQALDVRRRQAAALAALPGQVRVAVRDPANLRSEDLLARNLVSGVTDGGV